jgi:hypothetical protein
VLAIGSSDPVEAGVEVEVVDGRIVVEIVDVETRPEVIEAALRDVDLDASVTAYPTGPSLAGRFLLAATDLPGGVEVEGEGEEQTFVSFSAPEGLTAHLELGLGRPADDGEAYAFASDAYAPGEPLSCSDLFGAPVEQLEAYAADHPDLDVSVQAFVDGRPAPAVGVDDPSLDGLRAVDALATSADSVLVYANDESVSPFADPISPDNGACRE